MSDDTARRDDLEESRERGVIEAFALVLAESLDRETAAACIAQHDVSPVTLWPSGLYQVLATAATRSPSLFRKCSRLVESSLGQAALAFESTPSAQLEELAESAPDILERHEIAALVWSLLRRRDPSLGRVVRSFASPRAAGRRPAHSSRAVYVRV